MCPVTRARLWMFALLCRKTASHVRSPPNWIPIFWLHDMPDMFLCSLACFQLNLTVLLSCACWRQACNHVFFHESWMLSVSSLCLRWFPSCSGNAGVRAEVRAELQQAALHRAAGQGEDALQTPTRSSSLFSCNRKHTAYGVKPISWFTLCSSFSIFHKPSYQEWKTRLRRIPGF